MENVLTSLVIITLVVLTTMTLGTTVFTTQDALQTAWRGMERRAEDRLHTKLTAIASTTLSNGSILQVTLRNDGDTMLSDFDLWDVLVQYYPASGSYDIAWIPYAASNPANNQWTVAGIYLDAGNLAPEVYNPGILDPGEQLVIQAKVSPPVGPGTTNQVTVVAPDGIKATALIVR